MVQRSCSGRPICGQSLHARFVSQSDERQLQDPTSTSESGLPAAETCPMRSTEVAFNPTAVLICKQSDCQLAVQIQAAAHRVQHFVDVVDHPFFDMRTCELRCASDCLSTVSGSFGSGQPVVRAILAELQVRFSNGECSVDKRSVAVVLDRALPKLGKLLGVELSVWHRGREGASEKTADSRLQKIQIKCSCRARRGRGSRRRAERRRIVFALRRRSDMEGAVVITGAAGQDSVRILRKFTAAAALAINFLSTIRQRHVI